MMIPPTSSPAPTEDNPWAASRRSSSRDRAARTKRLGNAAFGPPQSQRINWARRSGASRALSTPSCTSGATLPGHLPQNFWSSGVRVGSEVKLLQQKISNEFPPPPPQKKSPRDSAGNPERRGTSVLPWKQPFMKSSWCGLVQVAWLSLMSLHS